MNSIATNEGMKRTTDREVGSDGRISPMEHTKLLLLFVFILFSCQALASDLWVGEGDQLLSIEDGVSTPIALLPGEVRAIARDHLGGGWVLIESQLEHRSSEGTLLSSVDLGAAGQGLAVSATGNAWVTIPATGFVLRVAPDSGIISSYSVGGVPYGVAIDRLGKAWVTRSFANAVTRIGIDGGIDLEISVGFFPTAIAAHPDGSLWIAEKEGVRQIDGDGVTLFSSVAGVFPIGVAIDLSGGVWFANQNSDDVSHFSAAGGAIGNHAVSAKPLGISALGDGRIAVLCRFGHVVEILDSTGAIVESIPVEYPMGAGDSTGLGRAIGADPTGDADGDGVSNIVEAGLGFNPLEAGSNPTFFIRGDANHDGEIDLGDVVDSLLILFIGAPVTCLEALDVNDDQRLDLSDPIHLLGHVVAAGPAPLAPYPDPGPDPLPQGGFPCGL